MKEYFIVTAEEKAKLTQKITEALKQNTVISFAYLYGSFIDPDASFRDIDVALYLENEATAKDESQDFALELSVEISREIGYAVDIQVINYAPLGFKLSVLKNGKLLFSKNDAMLEGIIEQVSIEYMSFHDIMKAESA